MKALIAILVAGAAMLTGCAVPAASAAPASVATSAPAMAEDDPGWNCAVDGNKICGPVGSDGYEAWSRFDPLVFPADVLAKPSTVTYRGTALAGTDFASDPYYTLASTKPGMVHVFQIEVTK